MSRIFPPQVVADLGLRLFTAAGASEKDARATTGSLVTSSLMGHDSHGVLRIPEYLGLMAEGKIVANANVSVQRTGPSTAIIDCGHGLGPVGARRSMEEAVAIAREQRTACVTTRRCNHVGRLGAWVQLAADQGFIGLATCNSPVHGHFVLPWGGREPRLATNPIAYAVPTSGDPVVADFSTSVAPEGKIRFYRNEGKPVPHGWILDGAGQPTNDPNAFYGPPRGGILPLGGSAGHKGFALGMLVEILGGALAGIGPQDPHVTGNGTCFIVLDPAAFCPLALFRQRVDETVAYMKSSPPVPGVREVLVPGELEFRTLKRRQTEGIPVDAATLRGLERHGRRLGVDVEALLASQSERRSP
jgi:hydroxycarboxylate dehydrogenase B